MSLAIVRATVKIRLGLQGSVAIGPQLPSSGENGITQSLAARFEPPGGPFHSERVPATPDLPTETRTVLDDMQFVNVLQRRRDLVRTCKGTAPQFYNAKLWL